MKLTFLSSLGISLLFYLLPSSSLATHFAGGDITYEYVGDKTGTPYEYCVTLTLYRRELGAPVQLAENVNVNSGCYGPGTIQVTQAEYNAYNASFVQGGTPAGDTNCVDQSDPGYADGRLEEYRYRTCTVLPGKCSDFVFSWSGCCRNGNITNILFPSTVGIELEAQLNNTIGDNTSPDFINPGAKFFCVGQPFTWSQTTVEPDGDSVYYSLGKPANTTWAPGYSTLQPMKTVNGFNINPRTGVLTFTPSNPEVDVLNIVAEEFRLDPVSGLYLQVGRVFRDIQVPVLATCNSVATSGITISQNDTVGNIPSGTAILNGDSILNAYGIDSIADFGGGYVALDYIGYDCFDSVITLKIAGNLQCSSIAQDGSDFRLIGPDSIARPIIAIRNYCKSTLLTDKVDLVLHKPLDVNGNYLLQVKEGNDSNTIVNECGYGVKPFYSLIVRVENCPRPMYELQNVSVVNDEAIRLDWWVDSNSITMQNEDLFNGWNIFRSRPGDPNFYLIDQLNQPLDFISRSYLDTSLEMYNLDQSSYQYRVQLVQNFKGLDHSNQVQSILLEDEVLPDSSGYLFRWSAYDGWTRPFYEVFLARQDSLGPALSWLSMAGPDANLRSYNWLKPDPLTPSNSGIYVVKVVATEPGNLSNPYLSESNWLYIDVPYQEKVIDDPGIAVVPNIFSPNGDQINDWFYVSGVEGFTSATIEIYNRWGKMVFKESESKQREINETLRWDGKDLNTAETVSDGVYYYVLSLQDSETGKSASRQGQVSVLSN